MAGEVQPVSTLKSWVPRLLIERIMMKKKLKKKRQQKIDREFESREGLRKAVKKDVLKAESRRQLLPDSWLEAATNHNEDWWLNVVQGLVTKHSKPTGNPDHGSTETQDLIAELCDLVADTAPPDAVYDGNMRTAAVMGAILSTWYARLQFAKASDPARPVFFRQLGYKRYLEYVTCLNAAMVDGRNDSLRFPGQKWENPFLVGAKGGDFI